VVHRQVVGDAEQPGRERRRAPSEPPDRLEHLQERLRRQVLGVVPVPDRHVQVAVDSVEVVEVELFERTAIALLRTRDQLFYALSLTHGASHHLPGCPPARLA
jgi:hypothetical protein